MTCVQNVGVCEVLKETNLFSAQTEISASQSTRQLVRNGPGMVCVCVHCVGVCMCRAKVGMT